MTQEASAGGIVYKKSANGLLILVAQHSQHHGWVFPKGLIGDTIENETREATAIREVEEETGIEGKIFSPLTPVSYWYMWEKEKRKKTVWYFIMEAVGGDIANHDHEMENVEWLPIKEVEARLTYKADKDAFKEARQQIEKF